MKVYGLMFDNLIFSPFVVRFVRSKVPVLPRISDVVVMHEVVKGGICDFIIHICTKNWMVLCELHQSWFFFGIVQDLHSICQCYEEVPMGIDPTVCNFLRNNVFSCTSGSFKGGWVVYYE